MSFGKAFSRMDAAIFKRGDDAIYNGTTPVKVFIDKGVEVFNSFESAASKHRTEIAFYLAEVQPVKGAIVQTDDGTYTLGDRIENDGSIIRFEAK